MSNKDKWPIQVIRAQSFILLKYSDQQPKKPKVLIAWSKKRKLIWELQLVRLSQPERFPKMSNKYLFTVFWTVRGDVSPTSKFSFEFFQLWAAPPSSLCTAELWVYFMVSLLHTTNSLHVLPHKKNCVHSCWPVSSLHCLCWHLAVFLGALHAPGN